MSAFPGGAARLKTYMEDFFRLTNKVKVRLRCMVVYRYSATLYSCPPQNHRLLSGIFTVLTTVVSKGGSVLYTVKAKAALSE